MKHARYDPSDDTKLNGVIACDNCGRNLMFDYQFRTPSTSYWKSEEITVHS